MFFYITSPKVNYLIWFVSHFRRGVVEGKRRECRKTKVWRSGFGVLECMKREAKLTCTTIPVLRLASLVVPTHIEALQCRSWTCILLSQRALLRPGRAQVQHWSLLSVAVYGSEDSGVKHNLIFFLASMPFCWRTTISYCSLAAPSLLMEEGDLQKEASVKYSRNFRGETGFKSGWHQEVGLNNGHNVFYRHWCYLSLEGWLYMHNWWLLSFDKMD